MTSDRFQRIKTLFNSLVELSDEDRAQLLSELQSVGDETRRRVQILLHADDKVRDRTARRAVRQTVDPGAGPDAPSGWIGRRIGAYLIERELGRGGMGSVFLAHRADGSVEQQVAIKVLHTQHLDETTHARFQREREILAGFEHPGIARLFDVGESATGEPYFVMEYLRGLSITAHCDQQRLGLRERLRLFIDVCDAVQYAHGKLILHRDIKPNNVIVDGLGVPRLIDFGIAKPLQDSGDGPRDDTALAQRFFSPVNAAPEQIRGDAAAVTCDVYQLGTLLYELLCGQALFDLRGKSAAQIEEQICELPPRLPSESAANGDAAAAHTRSLSDKAALQRSLRGDLDAITMRAVRKEPASRYASVQQLADDVQRYLENRPVQGRRGSTWYLTQRFAQRNWRALAVIAFATAGAVVFTALLIRQQHVTASERDVAVTQRNRAEAVTEFMMDIFKGGQASQVAGPETPVRVILKRGEELIEQRTSLDLRTRAELMRALALLNESLSDLDLAETQTLRAVELLESMPEKDLSALAEMYKWAGGALFMRDKLEESERMATKAVQLYDQLGMGLSMSWFAQLTVLRARRYVDPIATCEGLERLLLAVRKEPKIEGVALAVVLKSTSLCRVGSPEGLAKNATELRDAIHTLSNVAGPVDVRVMQLKQKLASTLLAQNQLNESAKVLEEVLPEQIRIYGEKSWAVAYTLGGLGNVAVARHDYAEAERLLTKSHAIFVSMDRGGPNRDLVESSYSLARALDAGNLDLNKARELYATAVKIGALSFGEHSPEVGQYSANYGLLLLRSGDVKQAEPLLITATANIPISDRHGTRARVALATIHGNRDEWPQADELLKGAEISIAEVIKEDPSFATEVQLLRTRMNHRAQKSAH